MSGLDSIKQKMSALRVESDEANARSEELATKVKTLEQETLAKEQEITSLTHRNQLLESEVEKLETSLKDSKSLADRSTQHSTENETLTRRLQLLEDEAEEADKNLREANDKLRQTDIKAGHFERKVAALQSESDNWEKKYEEMEAKYKQVQKELADFHAEIGGL